MKVFLSYTIRDGAIDSRLLKELEMQLRPKCSVYIDLLHNKSANPQQEVLKQLGESDLVIQIVTPSISDSEWACLEKDLAEKSGIPVNFVSYGQQNVKQLSNEILEMIVSNRVAGGFSPPAPHPACGATTGTPFGRAPGGLQRG